MNADNNIPKGKEIEELVAILDSKFFKALSEPVRINILKYLILNGRSDIAAIADSLPQDRSVISRHLQLMHDTGILDCEKITRHVYYEVNGVFFLRKMETILEKTRACMPECCPVD
ncbi:ArsR/SmtB family transcription factor [Thermodesulfobacteriota bacterium]